MNKIVCILLLFVVGALCQQIPTPGVASIPSNFNIDDYIVYTGPPDPSTEVSAFRFMCHAGQLSYDDPVVYPGQPGRSHLHQFYGNTLADAHSTYESLRQTGNSTCVNILNRSAYWMPAMMDGHGSVVRPDYIVIYYKRQPKNHPECFSQGKGCVNIPRGLRMVFGYDFTTKKPNDCMSGQYICDDGPCRPTIYEAARDCNPNSDSHIQVSIGTPGCWDGVRLDSENHRDHMASAGYGNWGYLKCPDTHPYVLPGFTLKAFYKVDSTLDKSGSWNSSIATWHLSSDINDDGSINPPGSTLHADWFGAWDDIVLQRWQDHCIDDHKSCNSGLLGDGTGMKGDFGEWVANPRKVPVPVRPTAKPTSKPTTKPTPAPTPKPTTKPTPAPTPKPTPKPVSYSANFNSLEANSVALAGYSQNNFTRMNAANTVASGGVLTLNLNTNGCPGSCAGLSYASGGWRKLTAFGYGTTTFSARGSSQSGSVLVLGILDWTKGHAIRVLLPGSYSNQIIINTFVSNTQNNFGSFTIPFSHSAGYNTYAVERTATSVRVIVNGVQVFTTTDATKVPTGSLYIELSYEAHPSWWGQFVYGGQSSGRFNSVTFQ